MCHFNNLLTSIELTLPAYVLGGICNRNNCPTVAVTSGSLNGDVIVLNGIESAISRFSFCVLSIFAWIGLAAKINNDNNAKMEDVIQLIFK